MVLRRLTFQNKKEVNLINNIMLINNNNSNCLKHLNDQPLQDENILRNMKVKN